MESWGNPIISAIIQKVLSSNVLAVNTNQYRSFHVFEKNDSFNYIKPDVLAIQTAPPIFWSTFGKYKFFCTNGVGRYVYKGNTHTSFLRHRELSFFALWDNFCHHNPLAFPKHAPSTTCTYVAYMYIASYKWQLIIHLL